MEPLVCRFENLEPEAYEQSDYMLYKFSVLAVPRRVWKHPEWKAEEYEACVHLKVSHQFYSWDSWPEMSEGDRLTRFAYYVREYLRRSSTFPPASTPAPNRLVVIELSPQLANPSAETLEKLDLSLVDLTKEFLVGEVEDGQVIEGFAAR